MSHITSSTFNYVDKNISLHLNCEICKLPVYDGDYHASCRHFRCVECNFSLHICEDSEARWYPLENDKFISQMLDKLQIYCPNRENGCQEIIDRSKYLEHLDVCDYNLSKCSNCEVELKKVDFEKHSESECSKRIVTCQYCLVSDSKEIIQKHLTDLTLCEGLDKLSHLLEHPMIIPILEKILQKDKISKKGGGGLTGDKSSVQGPSEIKENKNDKEGLVITAKESKAYPGYYLEVGEKILFQQKDKGIFIAYAKLSKLENTVLRLSTLNDIYIRNLGMLEPIETVEDNNVKILTRMCQKYWRGGGI